MIPRYAPNFGLADIASASPLPSAPGAAVRQVEDLLRAQLKVPHVVMAPSARGALRLLLLALPPPFDKGRVVVPAYTCSAVAEAARLAGREILPVEHGGRRINLAPSDLDGILRPGDVVIATHQYGYPCDIRGIMERADAAGACVIEDLAAALGATLKGQPAGSFGLAAFGSFDSSKLLHVPPKGGFAVTGDSMLAARLAEVARAELTPFTAGAKARALLGAALLTLGTRSWIYRAFYMLNFRLRNKLTAEDGVLASIPGDHYRHMFAEWQAAILLPQLRALPTILARRAAIIGRYRGEIGPTAAYGIEQTPVEQPGAVIRFPLYASRNKAELHHSLARQGVDTGFSFTTIVAPLEAKNAWDIARCVLNLPASTRLTDREVDLVIAAARSAGGQ